MRLQETEEQQNSHLRNCQQQRHRRQDRGLQVEESNEALTSFSPSHVMSPIAFTTVRTNSTCFFVVAACLPAMLSTCLHQ
jgi:hypothetical protein